MRFKQAIAAVVSAAALVNIFAAAPCFAELAQGAAVTDYCENLDNIYAVSSIENIAVELGDEGNYVSDSSRICRKTVDPEWFEYCLSADVASFEMTVCSRSGTDEAEGFHTFTVSVSSGGEFQDVPIVYTRQQNLETGDWHRYIVTPKNPLPEGVRNVRFTFPVGYLTTWTPQVADVTFTSKTAKTLSFKVASGDFNGFESLANEVKQTLLSVNPDEYEPGAVEKLRWDLDMAVKDIEKFDENTRQVYITEVEAGLRGKLASFYQKVNTKGDMKKLSLALEQAKSVLAGNLVQSGGEESEALKAAVCEAQSFASESHTQFEVNLEINKLRSAMAGLNAKRDIFENFETKFEDYITRSADGSKLMCGDKEYRFVSYNAGGCFVQERDSWKNTEPLRFSTPFEQEDIIKGLAQMNAKCVRTYVLPIYGAENTGEVHLLKAPGEYSEEMFRVIDSLLAIANKHGVRLIIPFIDTWSYHGGVKEFAKMFVGEATEQSFYSNRKVIDGFKQFISDVLNRTNSITGIKYKDDKAIMAWETGNELNPTDSWTAEIAEFFKAENPNQLLIDGKYGISEVSLKNPDIDIVSNHYYKEQKFARQVLNDAHTARKLRPVIAGEFNNWFGFELNKQVLGSMIDEGFSGALVWLAVGRSDDGGYLDEGNLHYPGQSSHEKELNDFIAGKAFEIDGLTVPSPRVPDSPQIVEPIADQHHIAWRGSVGATSYDLERSEQPGGGFSVIAADLEEGVGPNYEPASDTEVELGKTYYYRMVAKNSAGVSKPSKEVAYTVKQLNSTLELMKKISSAEKLISAAMLSPEYPNSAKQKFVAAIAYAKRQIDESGKTADELAEIGNAIEDETDSFRETKNGAQITLLLDKFTAGTAKLYEHSSGITGSTATDKYVPHTPMIVRTSKEAETFTYKTETDIAGFEVVGYLWPNNAPTGMITASVSQNGEEYTDLGKDALSETVTKTGGMGVWNKSVLKCSEIPSGTRYIRFRIENKNEEWNPRIDSVRLYRNKGDLGRLKALYAEARKLGITSEAFRRAEDIIYKQGKAGELISLIEKAKSIETFVGAPFNEKTAAEISENAQNAVIKEIESVSNSLLNEIENHGKEEEK